MYLSSNHIINELFFKFTCLLVLIGSCYSCSEKPANETIEHKELLTDEVTKIINEIAQSKSYMGSSVGYAGTVPDVWKQYEQLKKVAQEEELVMLCEHASPVIRCYAFQAVVEGGYKNTDSLMALHASDSVKLGMHMGCLTDEISVNAFFANVMSENSHILNAYNVTLVEVK